MSVLDDLFGDGSTAYQFLLWSILQQVLSNALQPLWQQLSNDVNHLHPEVPLSPAILADLVVRNYLTQPDAQGIAEFSGVSNADFALMVDDTGEPPPLQFLLEAYRRKLIGEGSLEDTSPSLVHGILESRVKDEWIPLIEKMATTILSPADWVTAALRGQVPMPQAVTGAYQAGITSDDFTVLLNSAGNPPSPGELVEFVRRGLIPFEGTGPDVLSFQQGIYEGDSKDKWEPIFEKLANYIPPARSVTAVYRAGGYTQEQAMALFVQNGLSTQDAAAYLKGIQGEKIEGSKQEAQGTITTLYYNQAISNSDATAMLGLLGYAPPEAAFVLEVVDMRREMQALASATTRIESLFTAHKIDVGVATASLGRLGIPPAQVGQLIQTWTLVAGANVKVLTGAEIADAYHYGVMDQATAQSELMSLGYTEYDAWVIISTKNKAPLPNQPARTPTDFYAPPSAPGGQLG